jgi:hypothetical protein
MHHECDPTHGAYASTLAQPYNLYFGQLPCTKINLVDLSKREDLSDYTAMLSQPRSQRNYMFL